MERLQTAPNKGKLSRLFCRGKIGADCLAIVDLQPSTILVPSLAASLAAGLPTNLVAREASSSDLPYAS
jgi:hypothetical protein